MKERWGVWLPVLYRDLVAFDSSVVSVVAAKNLLGMYGLCFYGFACATAVQEFVAGVGEDAVIAVSCEVRREGEVPACFADRPIQREGLVVQHYSGLGRDHVVKMVTTNLAALSAVKNSSEGVLAS